MITLFLFFTLLFNYPSHLFAEQNIGVVTVTAYHMGHTTASGKRVRVGHIAVSRDLVNEHQLKFGDKIKVHGKGVYVYEDRMPLQHRRKLDIYHGCIGSAKQFGKRRMMVSIIRK